MVETAILRLITILLLALVVSSAHAVEPDRACDAAAARAERRWGLPSGILGAVGAVESGIWRGQLGAVAWPWTINAAGNGAHFATKSEAIAAVYSHMLRGIPTIDIGCFQIDILYHSGVFRSLDDAFDPDRNADEAAKILLAERRRGGEWATAVAHYHSADPIYGLPYLDRVRAAVPLAQIRATAATLTARFADPVPNRPALLATNANSTRPGLPQVIYALPLPVGAVVPQVLWIGSPPSGVGLDQAMKTGPAVTVATLPH